MCIRDSQQPSASQAAPANQFAGDPSEPAKKRRHLWIWAVVLLLFGLLFYWVIQHHQKSQAAAMGGRHGMTGPVPVTTATARSGSIGVYLDAIGTVTPVYTDSITAQVTVSYTHLASVAHLAKPIGPAVAYSIGQGATMISALWGVFILSLIHI